MEGLGHQYDGLHQTVWQVVWCLTQLAIGAVTDESMELCVESKDEEPFAETLVGPCITGVAEVIVC